MRHLTYALLLLAAACDPSSFSFVEYAGACDSVRITRQSADSAVVRTILLTDAMRTQLERAASTAGPNSAEPLKPDYVLEFFAGGRSLRIGVAERICGRMVSQEEARSEWVSESGRVYTVADSLFGLHHIEANE